MPASAIESFRLKLLGTTELIGPDGREASALLALPKRFAVLVWLTLAGRGRLVRRDTVLALFWPEATADSARHSLRQALHLLRRTLGPSAITRRGEEEIAVDGEVLQCDALEFERAIDEGRPADALAMYAGDLLPGFHAHDVSVDFEQWLDSERDRLKRRAAGAAVWASEIADADGRREEALHCARLASRLAPNDEAPLRRLLELLDRYGDTSGALRAYDDFRRRLAEELEVEPGADVQEVAAKIRARAAIASSGASEARSTPATPTAGSRPIDRRRAGRARRWWMHRGVAGWVVAPLILIATIVAFVSRLETSSPAAVEPPGAPPSAVPTAGTVVAQRLYEQGLRAYYRGAVDAAGPLFDAALAEDSTLAMAAYYGSTVAGQRRDQPKMFLLADQALRMVHHAPVRDQLLVRVGWLELYNDPRRLAVAESLAMRYPDDPAAVHAWARALAWSGDGLAAIPPLRRVIASESPRLQSDQPLCRACDAYHDMLAVYIGLDSLAAAERLMRDWLRAQPNGIRPWTLLAHVLELTGRDHEALAAAATAVRLGADVNLVMMRARLALRDGRLDEADRLLREVAVDAPNESEALWWLGITLRNQGRHAEALTIARRLRALCDSAVGSGLTIEATVPVAQTLLELGRHREAAALFDSIATTEGARSNPARGLVARRTVWSLTHSATALAAAGDTAALARLATRIEDLGRESGLGRDRQLHHYVRGLRARARGDTRLAVRELGAIHAAGTGFTRVNLELGRALTDLGRHADAIQVLRPPLRGSMEASGFYVTFRELHDALADAFAAVGQPDSAAAHRAWGRPGIPAQTSAR